MDRADGLISKEEQDEFLRQEIIDDWPDECAMLDSRMGIEEAEK